MTRPITTAPADPARAMLAAEMRGQDMQDAPERIWTVYWGTDGAVVNGAWADTVRHFGGGVEYTRTDLCITDAECQRRVDAAVQAEIANASVMFEQTVADLVKALKSADTYIDIGHYEMARNITRNAIRARGQK